MKELIKERRLRFQTQCLKYLKYVLNDHFVLVLLFLLGFILLQYSQLLKHFPTNPVPVILGLLLLVLFILPLGSIATYVESADKQFVLVKEEEFIQTIKPAGQRAFLLWGVFQNLLLLVLFPIFQALEVPTLVFIFILIGLLGVKYLLVRQRISKLTDGYRLNWDVVIQHELKRQQSILKFFALFTTVKGISTSVKRRAYLDKIVSLLFKDSANLWTNLYLRAFLRSGDYLSLSLRLFVLAIVCLVLIPTDWLAVGLAILFNYLLAFQLLALYQHYDYQYLTRLFPLDDRAKRKGLFKFLRILLYVLVILEGLVTLNIIVVVKLVILNLILVEGYLRYKVYKMID